MSESLKKFVADFGMGGYPLHEAIMSGEMSRVTAALKARYDPDFALPEGDTALHLAVRSGFVEFAEALLNSGASVHAVTRDRYTPLSTWLPSLHAGTCPCCACCSSTAPIPTLGT